VAPAPAGPSVQRVSSRAKRRDDGTGLDRTGEERPGKVPACRSDQQNDRAQRRESCVIGIVAAAGRDASCNRSAATTHTHGFDRPTSVDFLDRRVGRVRNGVDSDAAAAVGVIKKSSGVAPCVRGGGCVATAAIRSIVDADEQVRRDREDLDQHQANGECQCDLLERATHARSNIRGTAFDRKAALPGLEEQAPSHGCSDPFVVEERLERSLVPESGVEPGRSFLRGILSTNRKGGGSTFY